MITITKKLWLDHRKAFRPGKEFKFNEGGVVKFRGVMESGKTLAMMAMYFELRLRGYQAKRCFGNFWINDAGFNYCTNAELRNVIKKIYNTELGKWRQTIVLMMEADSVYSHLDYKESELKEDIRGFSQAMKLNNWFIYEMHEGLGVLKFLRDKTEISVKPFYDRENDLIRLNIINGHYNQNYSNVVIRPSRLHGRYLRFDTIV